MKGISYTGTIRLLLIGLALLFFGGCAGIPSLTKPAVTLSDFGVEEIKAFESKFLVDLRIINSNEFPITIRGVACDLSLNDRKFGTGVSDKTVNVPAFETNIVPVVIYSSMIDLVRGFIEASEKEQLSYIIEGVLRIRAGGSLPVSVPFEHKGVIDIKDVKQ